ncbi:hypothetical protein HOB10_00195 [Candidatus Parcubacteria bacterium]|jgi:hypothetical protein|nr:hypothetical protein [Candidatus Parcubacteria bacterium]
MFGDTLIPTWVESEDDISTTLFGTQAGTRLKLTLHKPYYGKKLLFLPIFDCLDWQKLTDKEFIVTLSVNFFQTNTVALFTRELFGRVASIERLAD